MAGLLIVNADDWGGKAEATDAIQACFEARSITSTTAMVWMADSDRAAEIAHGRGWPIGLHLNLDQPFDGSGVPARQHARQRDVINSLAGGRGSRVRLQPLLRATVRAAVEDQLERFRQLYGHDPTHVDGHHHIHLNLTVLSVLPKGIGLRPGQGTPGGGRGGFARAVRHALLAVRFRTPDRFHAIESLEAQLGGRGLDEALTASRTRSVEIMCHPSRKAELAVLLSPEWRAALSGYQLGSYRDLTRRGSAAASMNRAMSSR